MKTDIETLIEEALEILDHAELEVIDGGYVQGPGCGPMPPWNPYPSPFDPNGSTDDWGGYLPKPGGPIIIC